MTVRFTLSSIVAGGDQANYSDPSVRPVAGNVVQVDLSICFASKVQLPFDSRAKLVLVSAAEPTDCVPRPYVDFSLASSSCLSFSTFDFSDCDWCQMPSLQALDATPPSLPADLSQLDVVADIVVHKTTMHLVSICAALRKSLIQSALTSIGLSGGTVTNAEATYLHPDQRRTAYVSRVLQRTTLLNASSISSSQSSSSTRSRCPVACSIAPVNCFNLANFLSVTSATMAPQYIRITLDFSSHLNMEEAQFMLDSTTLSCYTASEHVTSWIIPLPTVVNCTDSVPITYDFGTRSLTLFVSVDLSSLPTKRDLSPRSVIEWHAYDAKRLIFRVSHPTLHGQDISQRLFVANGLVGIRICTEDGSVIFCFAIDAVRPVNLVELLPDCSLELCDRTLLVSIVLPEQYASPFYHVGQDDSDLECRRLPLIHCNRSAPAPSTVWTEDMEVDKVDMLSDANDSGISLDLFASLEIGDEVDFSDITSQAESGNYIRGPARMSECEPSARCDVATNQSRQRRLTTCCTTDCHSKTVRFDDRVEAVSFKRCQTVVNLQRVWTKRKAKRALRQARLERERHTSDSSVSDADSLTVVAECDRQPVDLASRGGKRLSARQRRRERRHSVNQ